MGNEFIFVSTDDWEGYYINGRLKNEGHRMESSEWLELIEKNTHFTSVKSFWVDEEYMHDIGSFPEKFSEIPKEALS